MSWFSAVTGKAEDFLNKLDKSAADVLHSDDSSSDQPIPIDPSASSSVYQDFKSSSSLSPSQSVPVNLHNLQDHTEKSSSYVSSAITKSGSATAKSTESSQTSTAKSVKKKNSDEALFDFLNSKDSNESGKKRRTPISSQHHSRQSSTSSIVSSTSKGAKSESLPVPTVDSVGTGGTTTNVGAQGIFKQNIFL